jgi:hypothetical protein
MRLIGVSLLGLAAMSMFSSPGEVGAEGSETKPLYRAYRLAAQPRIDGNVRDEPAWQGIPGVTGFHVLGGGYTVAKQTTARIGWTVNGIYVGVDCEEPDIDLVDDKLKDGDSLWLDNGVEIFLQLPKSSAVLQFIVNTAGSRRMGEGQDKVALTEWKARALKGDGFWSVELEIPFACLEAKPSPGSKWRGAVCRNIWKYRSGGDKFTAWPRLSGRFREPENYAFLDFDGGTLTAEQAEQIALKLNIAYRRHLSGQIDELARAGKQYEAPLAKAASANRFAEKAKQLNQAWLRIGSLAADSANASLPEVRKYITMAKNLKQRSYDLKYRFLIEQLLAE